MQCLHNVIVTTCMRKFTTTWHRESWEVVTHPRGKRNETRKIWNFKNSPDELNNRMNHFQLKVRWELFNCPVKWILRCGNFLRACIKNYNLSSKATASADVHFLFYRCQHRMCIKHVTCDSHNVVCYYYGSELHVLHRSAVFPVILG